MEKIKLNSPIKIDGVAINELNLRTPKVRDIIAANRKNVSESEREVNLIANLAEISVENVEDLDLKDYMKIQTWLQNFLSAETQTK